MHEIAATPTLTVVAGTAGPPERCSPTLDPRRRHSSPQRQGQVVRRARRAATTVLASIVVVLAVVCSPTVASANQMTLFSCHTPSGQPVGHAGWTIARTADEFMFATDTCGPNGTGLMHLEMAANGAGYGNLAGIDWIFQAPAWATIASYTIQAPDSYAYPYQGAGVGQAAIWANDETDPIYDYRNLGGGSWGAGTIQRTPPDIATWLALNVSCDGDTGRCPVGTTISRLDVSSTALVLDDPTVPTVTGIAGNLTSGGELSGETDVSFTASDKGPGVYSAWLTVDGKPQPSVLLDSNGGWCTNLGQTSDGTRSFANPDPCAETVNGQVTLNTASLTDGSHRVQLNVDDASGNSTTAYNTTITTHNAPNIVTAPSVTGSATVGGTLTGTDGSFSAPEGAGTLSNITRAWLRCSDPAATHCATIPGASSNQFSPDASDTGYYIVYQNTIADKDGTTSADSQPTVAVANASQTAGGGVANGGTATGGPGGTGGSTGAITVNIASPAMLGSTSPWQVNLQITPRTVHRGTTIKLAGAVPTSPRPSAGKLVYLRARTVAIRRHGNRRRSTVIYGKWVTFMQLRTSTNGRFTGRYTFKLAGHHTYQFIAIAPQEGGYLNTTGASNTVILYEA